MLVDNQGGCGSSCALSLAPVLSVVQARRVCARDGESDGTFQRMPITDATDELINLPDRGGSKLLPSPVPGAASGERRPSGRAAGGSQAPHRKLLVRFHVKHTPRSFLH